MVTIPDDVVVTLIAAAPVLTKREWPIVLLVIARPGPWRVKDLAEATGMNKGNVSRVRAGLIRDGVILEHGGGCQFNNRPETWEGKHLMSKKQPADIAGTDVVTASPTIISSDHNRSHDDVEGGTGGEIVVKTTSRPGRKRADVNTASLSREERLILHELRTTLNYPYDYEVDLRHIRNLMVDYPELEPGVPLDLLNQIKKWKDYLTHHPLRKRSNPRLQIRNWCENAIKFAKERRERRERSMPSGGYSNGRGTIAVTTTRPKTGTADLP